MPLYEYRCPRCITVTDLVRAIGERDDPARCPHCGTLMHRLPGGAGARFRIRGAGWRPYTLEGSVGDETHESAWVGEDELVGEGE